MGDVMETFPPVAARLWAWSRRARSSSSRPSALAELLRLLPGAQVLHPGPRALYPSFSHYERVPYEVAEKVIAEYQDRNRPEEPCRDTANGAPSSIKRAPPMQNAVSSLHTSGSRDHRLGPRGRRRHREQPAPAHGSKGRPGRKLALRQYRPRLQARTGEIEGARLRRL
jgi:hypothetical protein